MNSTALIRADLSPRHQAIITGVADLVMLLETAQRQDRLKEVLHRAVNTYRLLIIGKIGYLPMGREQGNLFFQVVSRV
jgi:DNA replication protein DnaC